MTDLALNINSLLPQTQCQQCGYENCAAYADAVANKRIPINLCLPGGNEVMGEIAVLTGRAPFAVREMPSHSLALIDEMHCIGCTACIKACPVDAIVGATRLMHTIMAGECTGCGLCLPVCPVNCIKMQPEEADYLPQHRFLSTNPQARFAAAEHAYARFTAKIQRMGKQRAKLVATATATVPDIKALLERAKLRAASDCVNGRTPISSQELERELLARRKKAAAYRNARRDLRYGDADVRQAALAFLRREKE